MGWTFHSQYNSPRDYETEKKEVERIYSNNGKNEILQMSKVGNVWYLAVKLPEGGVWAGVCLTKRDKGEWGYKDMDEQMMPYYFDAPASLIKKLSPTKNEDALKWRQACLDLQKEKKEKIKAAQIGKAKLQVGMDVDVTGLFGKYAGKDLKTFRVVNVENRQFWSPDVFVTFTLKKSQVDSIAKRIAA